MSSVTNSIDEETTIADRASVVRFRDIPFDDEETIETAKPEIKYRSTPAYIPGILAYNNSRRTPQLAGEGITVTTREILPNRRVVKNENPISEVERAILQSANPLTIDETEEISANNIRGIWANRQENINWRGPIPLEQYRINADTAAEIIRKKPAAKINYKQDINVRFLNPPTPARAGDIIIRQLPNKQLPPAPPLVIRQAKARLPTPAPVIIREAPPKVPQPIEPKLINIAGKLLPPPARKLVVERLPQIPAKPQSIFIERWLPFKPQTRRVIFQRPTEPDIVIADPKNVIIEWESPEIDIRQEIRNLGVFNADIEEYVRRYSAEIRTADSLPRLAQTLRAPEGLILAAEQREQILPILEGDVEALRLIDLDRVGLSEYRSVLNRTGYSSVRSEIPIIDDEEIIQ